VSAITPTNPTDSSTDNSAANQFQELQRLRAAAEANLARGFYIFPCGKQSKNPLSSFAPHGFKSSHNDDAALRAWDAGIHANHTIDCGKSNLAVIDCDYGLSSFEDFEAWRKENNLPETFTVRTGRRDAFGVQMYYSGAIASSGSAGFKLGNVVGEIKSIGGYVVGVGSVHPSGELYAVLTDKPIVPLPDHIKQQHEQRQHEKSTSKSTPKSKGSVIVTEPSTEIIPAGQRWNKLRQTAGRLRNAGLDEEGIEAALWNFLKNRCEDGENYPADKVAELAKWAASDKCDELPLTQQDKPQQDKQQPEQIIAPDNEVNEVTTGDLTDAVLDGKLGDICQGRLGIFPLAYAWISLVTAASTLVPRLEEHVGGVMVGLPDGDRANLYGCTIGAIGTSKSLAADQAFYALGMKKGQANAKRLREMKAGSAEGLVSTLKDVAGESRLFYPRELVHLLDKVAINNSSFQAVLNDAFDQDFQSITLAHSRTVEFNCRLSILGGIVEELFDKAFGAQTVGGLHSRFIFGYSTDTKPFHYDESLLHFDAEKLSPCHVTIHKDVYAATGEWIKSGELTDSRVIRLALKVAVICASFDGRNVLRAKDLAPTLAFAKYQERVRIRFSPNAGESPEAQCEVAIVRYLTQHDGWQQHSRIYRGIHAYRHGEEVFGRAIKALLYSSRIQAGRDGNSRLYKLSFDIPESHLQALLAAPLHDDWGQRLTFKEKQ